MRIAVTASGDNPDSPVDGRFVSARYLLVFDTANGQWDKSKFSLWSRQQKHSGMIRGNLLAERGVEALISGGIDPVSFKELGKRGIRIYQAPDSLAREAAEMFVQGRLSVLQVPDALDVTKLVKGRPTIFV